jgi:RING finger/CHY zinc finger protein 1
VKDEGERDVKKAHKMERTAVTTVACMRCGAVQAADHSACAGCGVEMGAYFCPKCKFYDDDLAKGLWHCDGCGLCRVGGRDNFFHCGGCGVCLRTTMRDHKCMGGAMLGNCPVCMENMHTSRMPCTQMRCGHWIHQACLADYASTSSQRRCPLCAASLVDRSREWLALDLERAMTRMPAEYAHLRVRVLCNDCHAETDTAFHVVGLKCMAPGCGSYNTRRVGAVGPAPSGGGGEAAGGAGSAAAGAEALVGGAVSATAADGDAHVGAAGGSGAAAGSVAAGTAGGDDARDGDAVDGAAAGDSHGEEGGAAAGGVGGGVRAGQPAWFTAILQSVAGGQPLDDSAVRRLREGMEAGDVDAAALLGLLLHTGDVGLPEMDEEEEEDDGDEDEEDEDGEGDGEEGDEDEEDEGDDGEDGAAGQAPGTAAGGGQHPE